MLLVGPFIIKLFENIETASMEKIFFSQKKEKTETMSNNVIDNYIRNIY